MASDRKKPAPIPTLGPPLGKQPPAPRPTPPSPPQLQPRRPTPAPGQPPTLRPSSASPPQLQPKRPTPASALDHLLLEQPSGPSPMQLERTAVPTQLSPKEPTPVSTLDELLGEPSPPQRGPQEPTPASPLDELFGEPSPPRRGPQEPTPASPLDELFGEPSPPRRGPQEPTPASSIDELLPRPSPGPRPTLLEVAGRAGAVEVDFGLQGAADPIFGGESFTPEALSKEVAAPPPAMELTGFLDGFDAGAGFATTQEAPYEGLALAARNLFTPLEDLLHDRAGGDDGVSVRTRGIDEICDRFAGGLVGLTREHPAIPLMVKANALHCEGRPVLREAEQTGSGLYRLHAAGVQTLTVVAGIDRVQARALAQVLTQPAMEGTSRAELEGDVARWFFELGLSHVRLSVLETFEEVEALPETGLQTLVVPDQAVEQMTRLRSRLLAAAAGMSAGRTRATTVPNLVVGVDDLRALERDLFSLASPLLGSPARTRAVLPYPGLPALEAEVRQALEADQNGLEARHIEGLLQTALTLLDPQRTAAVVERIAARPGAFFAAGEIEKGTRFLSGLKAWATLEPGADEKAEIVAAVLERTSAPAVLLAPLEGCGGRSQAEQLIALLDLLPAEATATLGIAVARKDRPVPRLLEYFRERLAEDLAELKERLGKLEPQQAAGLLDAAVAARSQAVVQLGPLLVEHESPSAREAVARACAILRGEGAQTLLKRLLEDEEACVRQAAVRAIRTPPEAAGLGPLLEQALTGVRCFEWPFEEKRATTRAYAEILGEQAKPTLRQLAERTNPYRRRSLSELRAAAALALAGLRDPADEKLALALAKDSDRRVVADAAKVLLQEIKGPASEPAALAKRVERSFARFDSGDDEAPEGAETAVRELSPHAVKAMRIDDLLAAPGDPVQTLGAALARSFSQALELARTGRISTEGFTIAVSRAANLIAALSKSLGDAPVSLQTFGDHFFVSGQRLRLPYETFRELAPLRETLAKLRVGEVLFAEAASKSDLIEALYALVTAMKVEREAWKSLERVFARVRLRELSLITESWGRQSEVAVDVRANAARLLGMLYLWLDDAAHLPDDHDLLPVRSERLVRELTDAPDEHDALLEGLLGPKASDGDAALYATHCVLLASAFARWLGCRRDQIASLVRCAMHRQLGLLSLPRPLLEDLGAENASEASEVLRAPLYSAARVAAAETSGQELLLPAVSAFESLAPVHATGARGQRYLRAQPALMCSRILAIAERYVFLTTSFPRRPALGADEALARMLLDPELEPRLVQAFANGAAIIPAGARVRLSDGSEAIVVSAPLHLTPTDPLVLKIALDSYGQPAADALLGAPTLVVTGEEELAPEVTGVVEAADDSAEWRELVTLLL